jgi:hypothetical protein
MGFVPSQLLAGASTGAPGDKSLHMSIFLTIFKIGHGVVAPRWVGSTPTPLRSETGFDPTRERLRIGTTTVTLPV